MEKGAEERPRTSLFLTCKADLSNLYVTDDSRYCPLPGPRGRLRVWVFQAPLKTETLTRNPAKGALGSESPRPWSARPRCVGSLAR